MWRKRPIKGNLSKPYALSPDPNANMAVTLDKDTYVCGKGDLSEPYALSPDPNANGHCRHSKGGVECVLYTNA